MARRSAWVAIAIAAAFACAEPRPAVAADRAARCLGEVIPASEYRSVIEGAQDVDLSAVGQFGSFVGTLIWAPLPDGRRMQLTEDYGYIDPTGRHWQASKGSCVDGASIPRIFWTVIGGPFEGRYRNASVLHDVACELKDQPWQRVHRMFYYAMRTGGVSNRRALLLYAAVQHFGPRWEQRRNVLFRIGDLFAFFFKSLFGRGQPPPPPPPQALTLEDVSALQKMIERGTVSTPDDVDQLDVPKSKGAQYR